MSEHAEAHEHHDQGFVRTYLFSTDHKMIGRQFLFLGLFMLAIGGFLAMMVRWRLAFQAGQDSTQWSPMPLLGALGLPGTDGGIIGDVAFFDQFRIKAFRQRANPPFQLGDRVAKTDFSPFGVHRLRYAPGNRVLIRHTKDQDIFTFI